MNEKFTWLTDTFRLTEMDYFGIVAIVAVCFVILILVALKQKAKFMIGLLVRMTSGIASIYFVNSILSYYHISTLVGINAVSLLTSAILGIPGVCLLYALLFL